MHENIFKINDKEFLLPGNRSCQGCGLSLAYRFILKALRENTIVAIPPSCLCVLHGLYPTASVIIPAINCTFAGNAASASGIVAALKALDKPDITVLALSGDGGTYDIGIQSLSGAAERNTDFIFACYDNEAYMNTGTQRSGATPMGAVTTTTPLLTKREKKKDFIKIMEAHDLPYLATVSPAYPMDLYEKFVKAKRIKGTRYMHIDTPCPPGWGYSAKDTIKIGKLAIETGISILFEIEKGKLRLTGRSETIAKKGKKLPVVHYVERQTRFKKMSMEQLSQLQSSVDERWNEYVGRAEL
jgi:pyruvate/2-oxoacid:ferredoxin oxidoreductase beta subunit